MSFYIAPIVEGETEVLCIERLLHRIWNELLFAPHRLQVLEPKRTSRDSFLKVNSDDAEKTLVRTFRLLRDAAKNNTPSHLLLLVMLDCDRDCPKEMRETFLGRGITLPEDILLDLIFPKTMFENWIVAGASTLAGVGKLPDPLPERDRFEEGSGANWLNRAIRQKDKSQTYKKTVDSIEFVRAMDLAECARNSPSFAKLVDKLKRWIDSTNPPETTPDPLPPPE